MSSGSRRRMYKMGPQGRPHHHVHHLSARMCVARRRAVPVCVSHRGLGATASRTSMFHQCACAQALPGAAPFAPVTAPRGVHHAYGGVRVLQHHVKANELSRAHDGGSDGNGEKLRGSVQAECTLHFAQLPAVCRLAAGGGAAVAEAARTACVARRRRCCV